MLHLHGSLSLHLSLHMCDDDPKNVDFLPLEIQILPAITQRRPSNNPALERRT